MIIFTFQINQGVEHQLSRTMVRDLSTTIGLYNGDGVWINDMNVTTDIIIRDLDVQPYQATWEKMRNFTDERTENTTDEIWLLEHPPVFTQGLAGKPFTSFIVMDGKKCLICVMAKSLYPQGLI